MNPPQTMMPPPPPAPPGLPPQVMPPATEPGLQPFATSGPPDSFNQSPFPTGGQPLFQPSPQPGHAPGPAPTTPMSQADSAPPQEQARRPRLKSPMLGGSEEEAEPEEPMNRPAQQGRGGLRSPLLRGEDAPDENAFPKRNRRNTRDAQPEDEDQPGKPRGKGGLRSPLLGGEDEEESAPTQRSSGRRSGPLRSPLLGGEDSDFGGGSRNERTEFPHRRRKEDFEPEDPEAQGRSGGRGLRSPLLGGAGADDDAINFPRRRSTDEPGVPRTPTSGHRRLHSPVLDGTGDYYLDEYEQIEEDYDEDDPNVLRSPLLAAKQKRTGADKPAAEPVAPPKPVPVPEARASAPPNIAPAKPQPQPQAQPHSMNTPSMPHPALTPPPVPAPEPVQAPKPANTSKSRGIAAPKDKAEDTHSRVPLSIYDSGLRDTIPGAAPVRSGPSIPLLVPAVVALVCKLMYFADLAKIKGIEQQHAFLLDQGGQALVLVGIIIFAISASKK